jgi:hypothetical protein
MVALGKNAGNIELAEYAAKNFVDERGGTFVAADAANAKRDAFKAAYKQSIDNARTHPPLRFDPSAILIRLIQAGRLTFAEVLEHAVA